MEAPTLITPKSSQLPTIKIKILMRMGMFRICLTKEFHWWPRITPRLDSTANSSRLCVTSAWTQTPSTRFPSPTQRSQKTPSTTQLSCPRPRNQWRTQTGQTPLTGTKTTLKSQLTSICTTIPVKCLPTTYRMTFRVRERCPSKEKPNSNPGRSLPIHQTLGPKIYQSRSQNPIKFPANTICLGIKRGLSWSHARRPRPTIKSRTPTSTTQIPKKPSRKAQPAWRICWKLPTQTQISISKKMTKMARNS